MNKRNFLIVFIVTIATAGFYSFSKHKKALYTDSTFEQEGKNKGEEIFNTYVGECLATMEAIAQRYSEEGVAVVSFVPGEKTESWNSRMRVVGTLSTETHNFLAVACAKSAEMALTLENSGTGIRQPLIGELGYKGGVIKKVKCGYLIASFSGAPAEIDAEISAAGVDFLSKYY
ncbi:hypothetical protein B0O79_1500 [Flavobacteriaceae bacterium MAR_2009_75]|nr:hypothetical protein B0O79_1500 [Flavobacteriaceae bacterium MAR_2009_75]